MLTSEEFWASGAGLGPRAPWRLSLDWKWPLSHF